MSRSGPGPFDAGRYDAVVYDLDGTLVRLNVDWAAAVRAAVDVLDEGGVDTSAIDPERTWLSELLDTASAGDCFGPASDAIAAHERLGARRSDSLTPADDHLGGHDLPVGVCSLNAEAACRTALAVHGLEGRVSAVVGRDTTETYKPDPGPLLSTLSELGVGPDRALFVGDSGSDAETAERAGVAFERVAPDGGGV